MFFVVCCSLYLMMETTPGSVSMRAVEMGEVRTVGLRLCGTKSFVASDKCTLFLKEHSHIAKLCVQCT